MRDHRKLRSETFDVLRFALKKRHRDEKRELTILMAGLLEHLVETRLHVLPDCVTVRPDDHHPLDWGIVRKPGFLNHVRVPLGIVFCLWSYTQILLFVPIFSSHRCPRIYRS